MRAGNSITSGSLNGSVVYHPCSRSHTTGGFRHSSIVVQMENDGAKWWPSTVRLAPNLVLSFLSQNTLQDSILSLGLAVAFYNGITGFACVWYFRRSLSEDARNFWLRGLLPLLGSIGMTWAFVKSATDMIDADYGYTTFGSVGGVFVIGVGMLALGVPLMLACAVKLHPFFRGRRSTRTPRSWCRTPANLPVAACDSGVDPCRCCRDQWSSPLKTHESVSNTTV